MKTDFQDCGAENIDTSAADQSPREKHGVLGRATPKPRKALAANSTKSRAGRPRRMIPWLDTLNGVFYVYWHDETKKPSRIRRRSTRTRDPEKAKKWYVRFLSEETSTTNVAQTLTVSAALDRYYREHVEIKVVDKRRARDAIAHLKVFFKGDLLKNVDIPASRAYADARRKGVCRSGRRRKVAKASDSTIRRELVVLKAAANHAIRWKRISLAEKPSVESPPEARREGKWLTQDETRLVLETAKGRLKDFLLILYYTAARRASIERLTRLQVDLKGNRINLTSPKETIIQRKSVKRRPIITIFDEIRPTVERLMEENADSEYLFGDPNDMYRPFTNHLKALGLGDKAFPHVMRHSRATHLLQDGVPIYDVARLLGDSVAAVDRVYGHHSADYMAATIRQCGAGLKIKS
jgi:integrase